MGGACVNIWPAAVRLGRLLGVQVEPKREAQPGGAEAVGPDVAASHRAHSDHAHHDPRLQLELGPLRQLQQHLRWRPQDDARHLPRRRQHHWLPAGQHTSRMSSNTGCLLAKMHTRGYCLQHAPGDFNGAQHAPGTRSPTVHSDWPAGCFGVGVKGRR